MISSDLTHIKKGTSFLVRLLPLNIQPRPVRNTLTHMPPKGWRSYIRSQRDRKREWFYQKHRKLCSDVLGRPRSSIPLAERRRVARLKYNAKLDARGLRVMRLLLCAETARRLKEMARARNHPPGAFVAELLNEHHGGMKSR